MPRIDCLSAAVRSGSKPPATHVGGTDDEAEEAEDAPAPEGAGLSWGFDIIDVSEALRGSATVRRWLRGNYQG